MERVKKRRKVKKRWTPLKIMLLIALVLVVGVGGFIGYTYYQVDQTVKKIQSPVKNTGDKVVEEQKPVSVLLLGVDQRPGERGRSDSIMVMTLNPTRNESRLISIPRDTKVDIVGKGTNDKINHAYSFGGPEMAIKTVEKFLNIPINYYAEINMEGFTSLVDAVGGVTVNNDIDFTVSGTHFPVGKVNLDGKSALKFTRMRYEDPRGDFGRQMRQREVIAQVANKLSSDVSVSNFNAIMDVVGKNAQTNVSFKPMRTLAFDYMDAFRNQKNLKLEGTGGKEGDGIYYWHPTEDSLKETQTALRYSLDME
ncbi:trascriptional regulator [Exiguobacterium indicum]|uniref:LCP family protein n=2 Tax=Exiguobacterium TaxID=33986 RepID=A0ABX8G835_EXIAC|nr:MULTISPECIES: LCP family protein [Exiguobacterium]HCD60543.1 LytR family transcriptional regulator [Exiguobacterium sp.]KNH34772.1 trascriptional regulator [Exiguobacterium acetylicum]KTR61045.1 trascriptional regulator [Exiguobacterium indicum]OAI88712.1 trascriptional regulator [Exiguobacterium sp. KKBO11]QWB29750.1 LCP family protein [Exiguobacterium acetylicum]